MTTTANESRALDEIKIGGLGSSRKRVEDDRFIRGKGNYTDDIVLPGMLHMEILRSPLAHARIKSVDTSKAWDIPGVHLVLTGDVPGPAGVDLGDAGVGHRAAQDFHVQHAGQGHVVGVVALAADEPVVLDAAAAGTHAADLDLVHCLGGHAPAPFPLSAVSLAAGASPRSFAAAHRTDLTMFW